VPAAATFAAALAALTPVVVHDAQERSPLASVPAVTVPVPGVAGASRSPTAYGRVVARRDGGAWLQWWLFSADQDQDRGVLRSGRHEGDWELVQARVDAGGALREVVVSQHSGAERCAASGSSLRVFAAKGAHGLYLRPGTRDRLWPDPNDEADGRGIVVRPRLEVLRSQRWLRWPGRWGASRAAWWMPAESDSPPGPAFQGVRWDDPEAFAASARSCQASCDAVDECDGLEAGLGRGALAAAVGVPLLVVLRRRLRRSPPRR
jgi:hypothetical protein